jgi:glycosyltransferase involved in cell wall biosynthesis
MEPLRDFSIIIPSYNCSAQLERLLSILDRLEYPRQNFEILVVDDGSSDDTVLVAEKYKATVVSHPSNQGRVITRESGAKAAKFENLVFIDARLTVETNLLAAAQELNYLPLMGVGGSDKYLSIIDRVFYCIRKRVYRPYEPQHLYNKELWLKPEAFNGRPKGTGLLIIDRKMFLECALEDKSQDVNDDTRLLRRIVESKPILRHTNLTFFYEHRQDWQELLRHTFFRGPKFLDYYLSPGGPLFWPYCAGLVGLVAYFIFACYSPILFWGFLAIPLLAVIIASLVLAEEWGDIPVCFIFFPPVGCAFLAGIAFAQSARWLNARHWIRH